MKNKYAKRSRISEARSREVVRMADKFVIQLEERLADRDVAIKLSAVPRAWLAEKGYNPTYGACPPAWPIQEAIKKPLADELLFGRLAKGGRIRVGLEEGKPSVGYPVEPPPAQRGGSKRCDRNAPGKRLRVPEYAT